MTPALQILPFTASDKETFQPWTSLPRPLSPRLMLERGPGHSAPSTEPSRLASTAPLDPKRRCILRKPHGDLLDEISLLNTTVGTIGDILRQ